MTNSEYEISDRLARLGGPSVAAAYDQAKFIHYWRWHRLGISDQESLAYMRNLLLVYELTEPLNESGWTVDRGAQDYADLLGSALLQDLNALQRRSLSGHLAPRDAPRYIDAGSGNGTAIYELGRPWVRITGVGLSLPFNVDGTLRNWLDEELRGESIASYRSGRFERCLKSMEIYSVARFVSPRADESATDPFDELLQLATKDATVAGDDLDRIGHASEREIDRLGGMREVDGVRVAAAIGLGFLLDALVGRTVVPNGMQFYYGWDYLAPENLAAFKHVIQHLDAPSTACQRLRASLADYDTLRQSIVRHLADESLAVEADSDLRPLLRQVGDQLRAAGIELRALGADEALVSGLQGLGNAFWRWYFFIEDLERWRDDRYPDALSSQDTVRAWLDRPWGVLDIADVSVALGGDGGSSVQARVPPLVSAISPLLRDGVDAFLESAFNNEPGMRERLDRLVAQRCQLRHLRMVLKRVSFPASTRAELAQLIVGLTATWFTMQSAAFKRAVVTNRLQPLRDAIEAGTWLQDLNTIPEAKLLSRRQGRLLDEYRAAASQVAHELFEFDSDSNLADRLDVFPPQEMHTGAMGVP